MTEHASLPAISFVLLSAQRARAGVIAAFRGEAKARVDTPTVFSSPGRDAVPAWFRRDKALFHTFEKYPAGNAESTCRAGSAARLVDAMAATRCRTTRPRFPLNGGNNRLCCGRITGRQVGQAPAADGADFVLTQEYATITMLRFAALRESSSAVGRPPGRISQRFSPGTNG